MIVALYCTLPTCGLRVAQNTWIYSALLPFYRLHLLKRHWRLRLGIKILEVETFLCQGSVWIDHNKVVRLVHILNMLLHACRLDGSALEWVLLWNVRCRICRTRLVLTSLNLEAQLLGVRAFSCVLKFWRGQFLVNFSLVIFYHNLALVTRNLLRTASVFLREIVPRSWSTLATTLHLGGLFGRNRNVGRNWCSRVNYSILRNHQ